MKMLVIGSKGFIGKHLFGFYSTKPEFECFGCDIVEDSSSYNYIKIDPDKTDFESLFSANTFDYCVNCSGAASVPDSLKLPLRDFMLNSVQVVRILDAIRIHSPACRFINMSSAAVYGNPSVLPVSEDHPCNPVSPYGVHKLYAEKICKEYFDFFNVRSCCIRIFSAYGPGLRKQIIWDLSQKIASGNRIELWGTGDETRDFVYITDIIEAIDTIVSNDLFHADIFNVASGTAVSIRQLAEDFCRLAGFSREIHFSGSERPGDPVRWIADIDKLKKWGYRPSYSLEIGLRGCIEWLKDEKLL